MSERKNNLKKSRDPRLTNPEKQRRREIRQEQKALEELKAMNNEPTKKPYVSKSKGSPRQSSKSHQKWKSRRYARYNASVWPGWRESDGKKSPVKVYKKGELPE